MSAELDMERIRAEQAESHRDWLVSVLSDIADISEFFSHVEVPDPNSEYLTNYRTYLQKKLNDIHLLALKSIEQAEDNIKE